MTQDIANSIGIIFGGKPTSMDIERSGSIPMHILGGMSIIDHVQQSYSVIVHLDFLSSTDMTFFKDAVERFNTVSDYGQVIGYSISVSEKKTTRCHVKLSVLNLDEFSKEIADFDYKKFDKEFVKQLESKLADVDS